MTAFWRDGNSKAEEWDAKLVEAIVLVQRSQETVALQRANVQKLRQAGASPEEAERMLVMFEAALVRREGRLDQLMKNGEFPGRFHPW